jgi:glycosyltransferase involved in cell wall biosynthesis
VTRAVPEQPLRILRLISRLNIGGPAIQAITLTRTLEPLGWSTLLVRGVEGPREGSMDELARDHGVAPLLLPHMRRDVNPGDLIALRRIAALLRAFLQHVLHTHAAKAGTLGRAATVLPGVPRPPVVVHTFHGHSLEGYFSARRASAFRAVERTLARRTDRVVAVSEEIRSDLVRHGIAPREKIDVVRLGFDLAPFAAETGVAERARRRLRADWRIAESAPVVTLIARLVPIKRVDRFLRVALSVGRALPEARFVVVGDGELHDELRSTRDAAELGERLIWTGFRRDIPDVLRASDVVCLTSDNEGTPVSLIEAQAASVPVVSTDVGGARSVITDGVTGHVVPGRDEAAYAQAVCSLLRNPTRARAMGARGRDAVSASFGIKRLTVELDALYRRVLEP